MGGYCLSSCNDPCCRFTSESLSGIWVSKGQLRSILKSGGRRYADKDIKKLLRNDKLEKEGHQFRIQDCCCPAYDSRTKKCGLYGHQNRPEACEDFPLYWDNRDEVLEADLRCPYMRENWETLLRQLEENHPGLLQDLEVRFSHFPLMCERIGKMNEESIAQSREVIRSRIEEELPAKRR